MSNAILYFHPDGYDTTGARLMGRHSAGESFLRGFLRYAEVDDFRMWNTTHQPIERMQALVERIQRPPRPVRWHQDRSSFGDVGVFNLPVPGLDDEAWARRPYGEQSYAICGITHTTATVNVMRCLGDMMVAPLHDYDALICTSSAVRASVEAQLDGVREHLEREYGPRKRPEPMRVTIPLGVNCDDFATSPADRKAWRERLSIPDDAIVALYVGRFHARAKMNPALMALALERAAKLTERPLYWVNSGWAESEQEGESLHRDTAALCPSVRYLHIDGRPADTRFSIWSVADLFISFSDNIQETFGLTPVEAMAAGLPCVVTDWDGYRDTVRDGQDGFRIPTFAPRPGEGGDLAYAFARQNLAYDNYVGAAGQFTAVDLAAAARSIAQLADDAELRQRMGAQARAHARAVFDWSAIIPRYQALWAEQNARRRAAAAVPKDPTNPYRPDPFRLFEAYPTHHLDPGCRASVTPGLAWADAQALLQSPLAAYSNFHRPSLDEAAQVFDWLGARDSAAVDEVAAQFPPHRRPFVRRGLLWMARFGLLVLAPAHN
jgi:glycosyltransferase involved in cell wall biosynthesis